VTVPRRRQGFERILCAIDGKEGGFAAVEQAAALAGEGGELTLLLVTSFRSQGERRGPAIGPIDAHTAVKRAEEIAEEAGVRSTIEVDPAAPPLRVVLDWASDHDLLAVGAPASSWLGGLVITGVADGALSELRTPLLTARTGGGEDPRSHILIATDALQDSEAAMSLAGRLGVARGSRLTVVHALARRSHGEQERVLAQAQALRDLGVPQADVVLRGGHPHEVVVDVAERLGASLIVQGSRRRTGVRTLGSVSRRIVHEAGCSVLTVPPETEVFER
jgi:nucleotide-binding universal stress UspA family protein